MRRLPLVAMLLAVALAAPSHAHRTGPVAVLPGAQQAARPYPFAAGEVATYRAGWGIFGGAGTGTLELQADTVRGRPALHAAFSVRGGIPGARIDERLESWFNPTNLGSLRYQQRTRYPRFSRDRVREFFAAEGRWSGDTNGRPEEGQLPTSRPLDEIAFLYVARTLDLAVGTEHVLPDYWRPDGNPVRLRVLRREVVRVPAGTYNTIVVQPIIRTSSLFAEGGEAEVYFSEGPDREIVMLRAKLSIATLTLRLEEFQAGTR